MNRSRAGSARRESIDTERASLAQICPLSYWERLDRVRHFLDNGSKRDRSFQEFLDMRPGGTRLAQERRLAREFVEGFHAADPRLISTQALAESGFPGEDIRETRLGRVIAGYDRVIEWLATPLADCIRPGAIVTRLRWTRGAVVVEGKDAGGRDRFGVEARAAIVAVPLGVLQAPPDEAGGLEFLPHLGAAKRKALDHLVSGSAVRVVLHLRERVWASEAFGRKMPLQRRRRRERTTDS